VSCTQLIFTPEQTVQKNPMVKLLAVGLFVYCGWLRQRQAGEPVFIFFAPDIMLMKLCSDSTIQQSELII
jgi:hypothetical protein